MQTVTLSEKTLRQLRHVAAQRGQDTDTLAEELLEVSLAVLNLKEDTALATRKPHRVMEFRGIAPTGRTADEIESDIEASREEWDRAVVA